MKAKSKEEAKKRHSELIREIESYDEAYDRGSPLVSDYEYDLRENELVELERENPWLVSPSSPTQRVRAEPLTGFERRPHAVPMLSLEKIQASDDPSKAEEPDPFVRLPAQDKNTVVELRKFDKQMKRLLGIDRVEYSIEPKVDGVSISVTYVDGILKLGMTRGDGKSGDVITDNIKRIRSIPLRLTSTPIPKVVEVRGEAFIETAKFEALNQRREEEGLPRLPNARNATAGILKQLDLKGSKSAVVGAVFYSFGRCEGVKFESHHQLHKQLKAWGLPVQDFAWTANDVEDALDTYEKEIVSNYHEASDLRTRIPYDIDGIVFKVDDITAWPRIPSKTKAPGYALVHKPVHWITPAQTKVLGITIQVGRTGTLTPVAELEPTFVQGSTVSRATLHNEDEILRKDIRVGDTVTIRKAGMVIPEVVEVVKSKRSPNSVKFDLKKQLNGMCPACGSEIKKIPISRGKSDSVAWCCPNTIACPAQVASRLQYFTQRNALDIDAIGGIVAEKLLESKLIEEPLDLFRVSQEQLSKLNLGTEEKTRLFGEKNAEKVADALNRAKSLPLHRWLMALAIPDLGEQSAIEVSRLHSNIREVAESEALRLIDELDHLKEMALQTSPRAKDNKGRPDIEKVELEQKWKKLVTQADEVGSKLIKRGLGKLSNQKKNPREVLVPVGPVVARKVVSYFESQAGRNVLKNMEMLNINPKSEFLGKDGANQESKISGLTIVVTGTLHNLTRDEAKALIRAAGAKDASSVSNKTDLLVAGENAGSKLKKAEELGVQVITEKEFTELVSVAHSDEHDQKETEDTSGQLSLL